ncbi:MAG: alpha-L-rhamnosidase [Ktedonobacterales bacterium]|nr:alpha-L-rhamnosidase [Ktedonobacterales bacterium]
MRIWPLMRPLALATLSLVILCFPTGHVADASTGHRAQATPWDAFNYAPTSRTLAPVAVYATSGNVSNPTHVLTGQVTRLTGTNAALSLDFGKEVGGITTLTFVGASDSSQQVGLAFSESSLYVGTTSDASNGGSGADGALSAAVPGTGSYTVPAAQLRGGFRYLTVFLTSSGWVDLTGVSLAFTAAPTMSNLSQYANYFYSNDDLLNKLWYAGAYTVQMDTIAPTQGRVWGPPGSGWQNNATVGVGTTVLVDGAKRDRTVWPGDLGVAVPTAYVSTGDILSTKNALTTLYNHQASSGELPYAGPQVNFFGSDTYHLWTLIGTATYELYSGDKAWLDGIWAAYKKGVTFATNKIDGTGLMNVTGTADWARGDQGGDNIAANALLYRALTTGATLATTEGDSTLAGTYTTQAANLKAAINSNLWDGTTGAYRDHPGSTLYPQDGNALAVWFGAADSTTKATAIAAHLRGNWNGYGAQTPEWNNNISPFPGSMELQAHFAANDDVGGIDLMKLEWGYMLNASTGTNSTFWEGYNNNGTFAYSGNYMSAAHGWSTGPTSALSMYVLGIAPDTAAGAAYHVIPHPANLTHVEGDLTVAAGKSVSVSYDHGTLGDFTLHVDASTNGGSAGVIGIPKFGQPRVVQINGATVWDGANFLGASGISSADQDANYVYFRGVQPGSRTFSYPAEAVTLSDTFGGSSIDTSKWAVIDQGLESTASSGIVASEGGGNLTLAGTTSVNYWAGRSLRSNATFAASAAAPLTVQVNRTALSGAGTGYRSSLWLWVSPTQYVHFSQNSETSTWTYNQDGAGDVGTLVWNNNDRGNHQMRMVHDGSHVHLFVDGKEYLSVSVAWSQGIHVILTGQARRSGDSVNATFANLTVQSAMGYEAEAGTNTLGGSAAVASCSGCSGGARIGWVGNGDGRNGTFRANGITVASAGVYQLTIAYTNGDTITRTAAMSINGGAATTVSFAPTANANTVTTLVTLAAGANTIAFSNGTYWGPDFDLLTIQ